MVSNYFLSGDKGDRSVSVPSYLKATFETFDYSDLLHNREIWAETRGSSSSRERWPQSMHSLPLIPVRVAGQGTPWTELTHRDKQPDWHLHGQFTINWQLRIAI